MPSTFAYRHGVARRASRLSTPSTCHEQRDCQRFVPYVKVSREGPPGQLTVHLFLSSAAPRHARFTRFGPRRAIVAGIVALALLAVAGLVLRRLTQPPDLAWQRIQAEKVFTVATDASYPPFSSVDANGDLFGFDVDLADEIGRRWGVTVTYENITYDALLGALVAGRDDAVVSAFVPQPDRSPHVAYSGAYFTSG